MSNHSSAPIKGSENDFLLRYLLSAVYWFDDSLQMHMEAAGWPRVSRTKSLILLSVSNGVNRPIHIAQTLGLTRQAVHLALSELEGQNLVALQPDPTDKRAKVVVFHEDPKGKQMRDGAVLSLARIEGVLRKRLGEEAYENLLAAMRTDWQDPVGPSDH